MLNLETIRRFASSRASGVVKRGDAVQFLKSLKPDSAAIVFLDPPFNLGKSYCASDRRLDRRPTDEYRDWLLTVVDESKRVLAPGGMLFLYHLPNWAMRAGANLENGLRFQHWIAVSMKNGFVRGKRLYPAHYALLMFSKGAPRILRRPKIPLQECRHCGEYIKDYGGYLPIVEARGVNLSDVWDDLSPVRHAHRKNRAANELPAEFFRRIIEISGRPGRLYVDPFAGSGTGVISALRSGMTFAACDIVRDNCDLLCSRISELVDCRRGQNKRIKNAKN